MAGNFVQLHNHTHYSLLDGASKVPDLVKRVKELGMPAVGITDHGNMHGAYELWRAAVDSGVKPIIGIEAYVTPETARQDKTRVSWDTNWTPVPGHARNPDDVSGGGLITHLTMWAENDEGLVNLIKASSVANLEGRVMRYPRMDKEVLSTYSKGVIASSGCPSGIIQTRLRLGQFDEALRAAGEFQDIFGKDNFYIELMDHGLSIESKVTGDLLTIAKKLGAPLLATNDSHYVMEADKDAQDAMLCINSGATLDDPNRFKFEGSGYYIKSAEEMRELFKDHPDACDNTLEIAERCNVIFDDHEDGAFMPQFDCPEGWDETSLFLKKVEEGLEKRYDGNPPMEVLKQADYECGVICQMQFCGYFLVVADYINWAKEHGVMVGPGRGSAAGAMVAYAMGITELDPLKHGLIFERFLNPERVSLPDIDVDFDPEGRMRVLGYVADKYGHDKVAQCVIYGTIKTKQALKDSARIMGFPFEMGTRITEALPPAATGGKDISVHDIFDPSAKRYAEAREYRELYDSDPEVKRITEEAKGIEGLIRQTGVHACATIMGSAPITDTSPLLERTDGTVTTTFEYHTCETLGLVKMDFLGLSNLTVIRDTLTNIEHNGKGVIDYTKIPLDDRETYQLLSRGDTLGVFQLDSDGMRSLLKTLKPDNFNDISALIALYRPGPMSMDSHTNYAKRKNGLQKITPIHPELDEPLKQVLDETYGLIIYQEQVQSAARILAGYSLGKADVLRRAMGKKKPEVLAKEKVPFFAGMKEHGYSEEAAEAIWEILVPFSGYAFNKAHSAAYGLLDRIPQDALPGRVHGRAAAGRGDQQEQDRPVSGRGSENGHPSALPGCQRVGLRVLRSRRRRPIRARGYPQRRRECGQGHHRGTRDGPWQIRELHGLHPPRAVDRAEQATGRIADQGGRIRFDRPEPPGAVHRARVGDRLGGRPQAQAGGRTVRPVLRHGGFGRRRDGGCDGRRAGHRGMGQEGQAQVRARYAWPLRVGPSAERHASSARRDAGDVHRPSD